MGIFKKSPLEKKFKPDDTVYLYFNIHGNAGAVVSIRDGKKETKKLIFTEASTSPHLSSDTNPIIWSGKASQLKWKGRADSLTFALNLHIIVQALTVQAAAEAARQALQRQQQQQPMRPQIDKVPEGQRFRADKQGFLLSDKGLVLRFNDAAAASKWIIKTGNKVTYDQYFEIANHPGGAGYAIHERGRNPNPQRPAKTSP